MTEYNEDILTRFADKLMAKAARVTFIYTAMGIVIGAAIGALLGLDGPLAMMLWSTGLDPLLVSAIGGAVILGLIGLWLGLRRSFHYRLQAHTVLCQRQIERNTRQGD